MGFLIMGNGLSGSTLLQSTLNQHPGCEVFFEYIAKGSFDTAMKSWIDISRQTEKTGQLWGNKVALDKVLHNEDWPDQYGFNRQWGWTDIDWHRVIDEFKVIWNVRAINGYIRSAQNRMNPPMSKEVLTEFWHRCQSMFFEAFNIDPTRVILVQYEQLVLRPESEAKRICSFLEIDYDPVMIENGPRKVAVAGYRHGAFEPSFINY